MTRELIMLSKSENYRQVSTISNLEEYFEKQRIKLRKEVEQLRTELYGGSHFD
jgi:hypothetical protein